MSFLDPPARQFSPRVIQVVALIGVASSSFTITVLSAALPDIARDLDSSTSTITWVIAGPLLAFAVFTPMAGKLGDLYGHRRMYLIGFTAAALMSFVTARVRRIPASSGPVPKATSSSRKRSAMPSTGVRCHSTSRPKLLGSAAAGVWLLRRHPWLARHIEREHLTEGTRVDLERAFDREAADLFAYQSIAARFPDSIFADLVEAKRARSAMLHSRCQELGLPATEFPETAHEWEATTLDGAYREALAFERITIDFYDRFLAAVSEMQIRELFLRLRCEVLDETIPQLERAIESETSGKSR